MLTRARAHPTVEGCVFAANLPFCSKVYGPVYVGTDGVTVLDLDQQAKYSFGNFSGALSHYNCETVYSPVRTCANCSDAYRQWVRRPCSLSLPDS